MKCESTITRTYTFCAAHRLHSDELSESVNQKIFGKCNNPNGHGHNYSIKVTVRGSLNTNSGFVTDVEKLDQVVKEKIIDRFDHQHLNFDPAFENLTTTGENLARLVWEILDSHIPGGELAKIGVLETRDNYFEYVGDAVLD